MTTGVQVAGAIVGGVAVFVGAAVGAFYLCMTAETRRQKRNREFVARQVASSSDVAGMRRALDLAAARGNVR